MKLYSKYVAAAVPFVQSRSSTIRVTCGISSVTEILHGRIHVAGYIYTGIDESCKLTSQVSAE